MIYTIPNFSPYPWQNYNLNRITRYNVIVAPRQHGKTTLMCELINTTAHAPFIKEPLINLCSDTAKRIHRIYSQRLNTLFKGNPLFRYTHEDQASAKILRADGSYALINFLGSVANPDGCSGTPAHLNIIDEAALVSKYFVMSSAMPATDKTEGITIVTGTVANNQYRDIFNSGKAKMLAGDPHWFVFEMKLDDPWSRASLSQSARTAIHARYNLSNPDEEQFFNVNYLCDWDSGAKSGKPYADEILKLKKQGRIVNTPSLFNAHIGTAWDDGRGCTAVWVYTLLNGTICILGLKEWHKSNLVSVANKLTKWYNDNKFTHGVHCTPHTMKEKSYVHESQISREDQLRKLFNYRGVYLSIPKVASVESKFLAGQELLKYCTFSNLNLLTGEPIESALTKLERYSRVPISTNKTSEPLYKSAVKPDPYAHAGDAFGELALGIQSNKVQNHLSHLLHLINTHSYSTFKKSLKVLDPY